MARTIVIEFDKGILRKDFEELYNEIYDKLTSEPYLATVKAGLLTIDGSHI